ncbi:hypothetical protein B0H19DRAFT_1383857 [Mycena capillaripes]|nr:hypothetical protein B0H19DRAFT_1383857 [Mycena capillaripes]
MQLRRHPSSRHRRHKVLPCIVYRLPERNIDEPIAMTNARTALRTSILVSPTPFRLEEDVGIPLGAKESAQWRRKRVEADGEGGGREAAVKWWIYRVDGLLQVGFGTRYAVHRRVWPEHADNFDWYPPSSASSTLYLGRSVDASPSSRAHSCLRGYREFPSRDARVSFYPLVIARGADSTLMLGLKSNTGSGDTKN